MLSSRFAMSFDQMHLDRGRAEAFGGVAEGYDRHRPDFPDALFVDLAALGAREALDAATGTGKVARGLAARGLDVLGVEIDERMAAVARARGVRVEVAPFESWDDAGRRFDLVTCGDAWHWLDRARASEVIARVLRPGGTFARFWNNQLLDQPVVDALEPVYREHAPDATFYGRPLPETPPADPFPVAPPLVPIDTRTYAWERRVTAAEWAAFTGTISDHQRLPAERLARLQAAIRTALEGFGELRVSGATYALFARRP